jgi:hypothetical protein
MRVALAIVASMPILILSSDVDAFPGSPRQIHEAFIVLVAPGCGRGVPPNQRRRMRSCWVEAKSRQADFRAERDRMPAWSTSQW